MVHLEEDSTNKEEGTESEDPDGIKGLTEEFIVHLARAVKEAQQEEKHCYHCSSLEHFIHDYPLVKASRTDPHLTERREWHQRRESRLLQERWPCQRCPRTGCPRHRMSSANSLLEP